MHDSQMILPISRVRAGKVKVRALTRKLDSDKAKELAKLPNVEVSHISL